jgi:hypothetical protein
MPEITNPNSRTVSAKAQRKQYEISKDIPFVVSVAGGKKFKCRYLKEWTAGKISYLIVQRDPNPKAEAKEMIALMAKNNTISSKCVSLLILEKPWKIRLFHWYFWRWIYRRSVARELSEALLVVYEALDLQFFFQNMTLIVEMNTLKKRMTKTELKQLSAELQSERKPAS